MDGPATPRKRPWELHAIVGIFLIAIVGAIDMRTLRPDSPEIHHLVALAGMTFSLVGLFRGSRIAWWATLVAFAFLTVVTGIESGTLVSKYGFVHHRKLILAHGQTAACLVIVGLLLSLRFRRAIPPRAAPLAEDLPAFHAVLKVAAPIVFLLAGLFSLATPLLFDTGRRGYGERSMSSRLKTLASAEADFRANDRDWNHINDFWTGDVAGLYGIIPSPDNFQPGDGKTPIKLIELSTALADGHPIANVYPAVNGLYGLPSPASGIWFAALRADRSASPPEAYGLRNTSRFGFVAYSDDYIAGSNRAMIVNENNTIHQQIVERDLRPTRNVPPGPPAEEAFRDWPSDDDLKARWTKLD